ncbi:HlyD family secretion protein [Niabella hibiscisoli]|uniref:HlyD family secretion protein n=1 Tax=Niabella hibiscisoli TaxID=1825928 RepID=UPI001F0D79A7|nr:HlyD family efflux transporter periplasmic adaptor subunit [Niabella hibiscisoli]MCH5720656.1 HlyD family secretion protein [Niabella hibiscisoli]
MASIETIEIGTTQNRTEEVQDIIDRMPTKFGYWVAFIIVFIVLSMTGLGFLIKYPDVIVGRVTINTSTAPIKLVANTNGKLILNVKNSLDPIKEGEVIAYIDNPAIYADIVLLKKMLQQFDPERFYYSIDAKKFSHNFSLGVISSKYYNFLNALNEYNSFLNDKLYDKKITELKSLEVHQTKELDNLVDKVVATKEYIEKSRSLFKRDSLLYAERVLSAGDIEKSKLNEISGKTGYNNITAEKLQKEKEQLQIHSQITETTIERNERFNELRLNLVASYNDLRENINGWEQTYLVKAPFNGQVQFLKFWTSGQFVQSSEPLFTMLPAQQQPYGQVIIPANGAGKVQQGQEVVVKLDNYPYNEYGAIQGNVATISKTTNIEKSKDGDVETYLVTVKLKEGLITNYGKKLAFIYEGKGTAEIITKDKKLIERFFDNLKYTVNK